MAQLVTFSEFSRIKGVTRAAIGNAVRRGTIPCIERDGKRWIDLDQIEGWEGAAGARKEKAPAPPQQEPKQPRSNPKPTPIRAEKPNPQPKTKRQPQPRPEPKTKPLPKPPTPPDQQVLDGYDFLAARAKKESFEADLAEMKAKKEAGNLLDRDGVVKAVANAASSLRMSLELLPSKLGSLLAVERDPARCRQLLTEHVDQALTDAVEALREAVP